MDPLGLRSRQKLCETISLPPFEEKLEGRIQPFSSRRITGRITDTNPFIVYFGECRLKRFIQRLRPEGVRLRKLRLHFFQFLQDMGNESSKSTKAQKPLHAIAKTNAEKTKHVLILYKAWSERAGEIMKYFYDAFNQSKPFGTVEISSENAVDVSEHNDEYVRKRTSQWLMSATNVVLLCFAATQAEQFPREAFIGSSGKLPSNIFSLAFGTETPSHWPECYSLGITDLEKVERANDFKGDGLEVLVAAIRGTPVE